MKIEKNIPIPMEGWGKWKFLLEKMKVGDSLFVKTHMERKLVYQTCVKILKYKAITRKEENGFRIWRIK